MGQAPSRCLILRWRSTTVLLDCELCLDVHGPASAGQYLAPCLKVCSNLGPPCPTHSASAPSFTCLLLSAAVSHLAPGLDVTQLAALHDFHATLVSTPARLLALPLLHQPAAQNPAERPSAPQVPPSPVYCTQAVLDIAQHLLAELHAAETLSRTVVVRQPTGAVPGRHATCV